MRYALLFAGQGTQHARMLRWLGDSPLLRTTCAELGVADWRQALADAAWAARNANAQVLLTGVGLAAWQQLQPALPAPAAVAGYSVGELAAFAAAGVLDPHAAITLARQRAEAMDRCGAAMHGAEESAQAADQDSDQDGGQDRGQHDGQQTGQQGGLLAVSGLPVAQVAAWLTSAAAAVPTLSMAIRNAPALAVLGGAGGDLQAAGAALAALGARCTRLNIGIASHTPWMRGATVEFAEALSHHALQPPRLPLFSCTADRITSAAQAAAALAGQISSTLLWDDCLDNLHARGVGCALEIGPGAALAAMWNQRFPGVPARSADEFEDPRAIAAWVRAHA